VTGAAIVQRAVVASCMADLREIADDPAEDEQFVERLAVLNEQARELRELEART
jgi:hypothetical protein